MRDNVDILEIPKEKRSEKLLSALISVWRDSVRATHLFLTDDDIQRLEPLVPQAIANTDRLFVAYQYGLEVGFMGVVDREIEMLFLASQCIGCGLGRRLVELAVNCCDADRVDVNEQNPRAVNFYRHMGFRTFRRDAMDGFGNPFPILHMSLSQEVILETERLILRPWHDDDAPSLYRYASDPRIGPVAGWPPHSSEAISLEVIRTVFAAPETYAVVLRQSGEPVGSIGLIFAEDRVHSDLIQGADAEIGYWIGVPYWGQGLIPEAMERLLRRAFDELGLSAVWCGHYDGNTQSRRVMEKCGFRYHHTEEGKLSPLGDVRTEHFLRLTAEEWSSR